MKIEEGIEFLQSKLISEREKKIKQKSRKQQEICLARIHTLQEVLRAFEVEEHTVIYNQ